MSEPKWTPAQRAAIEDRGGALLVSAAAGSGDRKSTRLNSSHLGKSRMPSSA